MGQRRGKRRFCVAFVLVIGATAALAQQQQQQQQQDETFTIHYDAGSRDLVLKDAVRNGWNVLREYPKFNRLIVSTLPGSAAPPAAAAPGEATVGVASLQVLNHVASVERNGFIRAPRPVPDYEATSPAPSSSQPASQQQQGRSRANRASRAEPECAAGDPNNPDAGMGLQSEGVPYGISMVQADTPEMRAIAKQNRDKVLYCVIDTGLDITNQEFDKERTSGCLGPGVAGGNLTTRESFKYCYNWHEDQHGHGTHTSGTVAALRNGRGVVGVAPEGAHLYHYNFFGPNELEPVDLTVATWLECIDELDRRKAATNTPDMKLVISMSFGVDYPNTFAQTAIKTLAAERQDVIWFASAGNSGDDTMGCPACYPEVISVAAVDWNGKVAGFSTRNSAVDLAAPGVKTVSTVPLANTAGSDYYFSSTKDVITTSPAITPTAADSDGNADTSSSSAFFSRPPVGRIKGSPSGSVTADLVNCGLASSGCPGAAGKICLIQRGQTTFCQKLAACVAAGGVAAILYNAADKPACERFTGVDVSVCEQERPAGGWPLAVTVSRKQGEVLRAALANATAAGGSLSVSLNVPDSAPQMEIGLAAFSGTSMACPTAAGVAGLVWSAHTSCSSSEIRAALEKTAKKPENSTAVWTKEYGAGIVQALAAHQYLTKHPCSGAQVTTLETAAIRTPSFGVDMSHKFWDVHWGFAKENNMSFVNVNITVTDPETGEPIPDQDVRVAVRPGPQGSPEVKVTCEKHSLETDDDGVATAAYTLHGAQPGHKVTLIVKVPAGGSGFKEVIVPYELVV